MIPSFSPKSIKARFQAICNYLQKLFFCSGTSNFAYKFTTENNFVELSVELNEVNTVKPLAETTFRKRPPLLSDQISKIPKVFKSNYYILNPLLASCLPIF